MNHDSPIENPHWPRDKRLPPWNNVAVKSLEDKLLRSPSAISGLPLPAEAPLPFPSPSACNANPQLARTHIPFIPHNRNRVNPWLASLAACGIPYLTGATPYPILWVPSPQARDAQREIRAYEALNRNWPKHSHHPTSHPHSFSHPAICTFLLVSASLCQFSFWLTRTGREVHWKILGQWDPQDFLRGEWWRSITALTLHADTPHLVANAAWCFLYGTLVASDYGAGRTMAMMLATGTLGNATMAFLGGHHQSLGASTMIFGLLGILAATHTLRAYRKREEGRGLVRLIPMVPLAFAIAITAFTGAAPGADALAHACGFAWGIALGTLNAPYKTGFSQPAFQIAWGTATLICICTAWFFALAHS